jgi:nucleotide-binding universal stress UspA family protein
MSKTILVGLDGSPRQPKVLEHAIALAEAFDGRLHLARAMAIPLSIPAAAWTLQGDDFSRFLVEHGRRELEEAAASLGTSRVAEVHCRIGQPHDVIVALAGELPADLVVIGSHGYEGVDRLLGTTAGKVVNRAPCSVLVVR